MTSQIRVDEITNRSGLGTVTIYDNGFEFTGVTTFKEDVDITGGLTIGGVLTYEDTTNIDSVGLITARAGIRVTGDSIHVESSEDRLLYLKSTDANAYLTFEDTDSSSAFANRVGTVSDGLYFSTGGGGERLRIDSSGRVLIGRTTPLASSAEKLTIDSGMAIFRRNSTNAAALYIRNEDTTADTRQPYLIFTDGGGNRGGFGVQYNESSLWISGQNGIAFRTGGSAPSTAERLRITSEGKLLIGSDTGSVHGNRLLQVGKTDRSETYVSIVSSTSGESGLLFADTTTNDTGGYRGQIRYHHSDDSMNFRTGASERVRITSAGLVGIGENSPDRLLHIKGASSTAYSGGSDTADYNFLKIENTTNDKSAGIFFQIGGNGEAAITATEVADGNTDIAFQNRGGGVRSEKVRITSDGKMGVGTASPNHKLTLHNSGTGTFDALNITSGLTNVNGLQLGIDSGSNVFFWHTANGAIKFATNNSERMRVFGTGACLQINTTGTPTTGGFQLPQISIKQTAGNWTGGIHIESSGSTKMGCIASTEDGLELSQSYRSGTNYGQIIFRTSGIVRSKLLSNGYFQMGSGYLGSTGYHRFNGINDTQGSTFFVLSGYQGSGGSSGDTAIFNSCNTGASANSSACAVKIFRNSSTTRSINASGTINASGADYAEYMTKAGNFTLAKGDVCGVNSEGKLTNVFADAISFVVKSTDPSYVGGDKWHEVAGVEPGGYDDTRTEEEIAAAKVVYEEALESARQLVDRIAFSGQVPVNVTGATPGQHIIPTAASDGSIEGTAKAEADLTMAEYMSSVGKVIAIEDDGRARIIVKVA